MHTTAPVSYTHLDVYKRQGTRTLIIANTVPRAREIFAAVRSEFPGASVVSNK